ncbi:unnamed protein product [Spirodela intermedia]|uniref:Uncharacterized protein n=1 Tax=Spirodela intermedia TaxID=51605 RepID=A0A7I8JJK2_SPIIN|nr:unnamed protein product [Spirodela intermedia]CAA6670346.1 unnamed protein product [Spirodela intermedia]
MDSLEESLPVKRGLSNWFSGKSKSFACLSEAAALGSAKDMAKKENPFNKRRRILTTCKASWQRRASYAALNTSVLRALREDGVDHEDDDDDDEDGGGAASHPFQRKLDGAFRSPDPSPSPIFNTPSSLSTRLTITTEPNSTVWIRLDSINSPLSLSLSLSVNSPPPN